MYRSPTSAKTFQAEQKQVQHGTKTRFRVEGWQGGRVAAGRYGFGGLVLMCIEEPIFGGC
jgi:hypothetical protein